MSFKSHITYLLGEIKLYKWFWKNSKLIDVFGIIVQMWQTNLNNIRKMLLFCLYVFIFFVFLKKRSKCESAT